MLASADCNGQLSVTEFAKNKYDPQIVSSHFDLLFDAGYALQAPRYIYMQHTDIERLTFAGHQYLESIKNNDIWEKTKEKILSSGLSLSFDLIKSTASTFLLNKLNL